MLEMLLEIGLGLGLFLFGMKTLTKGLNQLGSEKLQIIVKKFKLNTVTGLIIGTVGTSFLQSSSSATVIIISLTESGLLSLYQAVPIIMGANIGTTVTAQLTAFQPGKYSSLFILIGLLMTFSKKKPLLYLTAPVLGLSLIFTGIHILSQGTASLKDLLQLQVVLKEMGEDPLLGILIGFSITAILQSSSAGIAILQSLSSSGAVSLSSAAAVLLGLNIGTCITGLLACIPLGITAKRAAIIHLLFNLFGVIVVFPFIDILCRLAVFTSPGNVSRQIANVHIFFNLFSAFIFIPFCSFFVKLSSLIIKDY